MVGAAAYLATVRGGAHAFAGSKQEKVEVEAQWQGVTLRSGHLWHFRIWQFRNFLGRRRKPNPKKISISKSRNWHSKLRNWHSKKLLMEKCPFEEWNDHEMLITWYFFLASLVFQRSWKRKDRKKTGLTKLKMSIQWTLRVSALCVVRVFDKNWGWQV